MNGLLAKAHRAEKSAIALLQMGDAEAAINRAYYAMYDAARAALQSIDPVLAAAKKHSTVIGRFSKYFVQERNFPKELGRSLSRAFDSRLVADYSDAPVAFETAAEVVEAMQRFIRAVEAIEGLDRK